MTKSLIAQDLSYIISCDDGVNTTQDLIDRGIAVPPGSFLVDKAPDQANQKWNLTTRDFDASPGPIDPEPDTGLKLRAIVGALKAVAAANPALVQSLSQAAKNVIQKSSSV